MELDNGPGIGRFTNIRRNVRHSGNPSVGPRFRNTTEEEVIWTLRLRVPGRRQGRPSSGNYIKSASVARDARFASPKDGSSDR